MVAMDKYDKPSEAVRGGIKPTGLSTNRQGRASKLVQATPVLSCPRGRTIYVISEGLEACSANHPAIQENTKDIGGSSERIESESPEIDEISFTAEEREGVLAPHHDALVVSLSIANCLVKKYWWIAVAPVTSSSKRHIKV